MITATKPQLEIEAEVQDLGIVKYVEVPFDEGAEALGADNFISGRNLAFARIQQGENHSLSKNGSYIREGDILIPREGIVLVRFSYALTSPSKATEAHRQGKEFFITKKRASDYLELAKDPRDNTAFLLTDITPVPTNRFGEDARTIWLFQDKAIDYGEFLDNEGISVMPLSFNSQDYINEQGKPYANQLWLRSLPGGSGVVGDYWGLAHGDRVRGVFSITGKARAQKIQTYTLSEVSKVLVSRGVTGALEKEVLDGLKALRKR